MTTDPIRAAAEEIIPVVFGYPPGHVEHAYRGDRVKMIESIIRRHVTDREAVLREALEDILNEHGTGTTPYRNICDLKDEIARAALEKTAEATR